MSEQTSRRSSTRAGRRARPGRGRGEHPRAIPWLVGLVADGPYDEPVHQALVRSRHLTRRHGEARRCYRTYVSRMEEIDAAPVELEACWAPLRLICRGLDTLWFGHKPHVPGPEACGL
ncbi:MAG: DNA-binding transcriptional activator of the family [Nocardioides sp.]|nr:DNA-binding transcriptional activator of the family [Nocardioides sp.]